MKKSILLYSICFIAFFKAHGQDIHKAEDSLPSSVKIMHEAFQRTHSNIQPRIHAKRQPLDIATQQNLVENPERTLENNQPSSQVQPKREAPKRKLDNPILPNKK